MIYDIFLDAFRYTTRDTKLLLKLGVMAFFSFLIIPLILLGGYSLRVVKIGAEGVVNGQDPVPAFKNWSGIFVDGVKVLFVKVVYLIIPCLIFISAYFAFISSNHWLVLLLLIIGVILALISLLFYYLAIPSMAVTGNISEAFKFKRLYEKMKSISIGTYIGFYIVLCLIELAIYLTTAFILQFIFIGLGGVVLYIGGITINAAFISFFIKLVILLLVYPFTMLIKSRCVGLFYSLSD